MCAWACAAVLFQHMTLPERLIMMTMASWSFALIPAPHMPRAVIRVPCLSSPTCRVYLRMCIRPPLAVQSRGCSSRFKHQQQPFQMRYSGSCPKRETKALGSLQTCSSTSNSWQRIHWIPFLQQISAEMIFWGIWLLVNPSFQRSSALKSRKIEARHLDIRRVTTWRLGRIMYCHCVELSGL